MQQTPRRRSMFASTAVEVSDFESDNDDNYERRLRRNSRRHSNRPDVKKKRHKIIRHHNSDSNSENQSDDEGCCNSSNYLHVPRDYKSGRRRRNSERRRLMNIENVSDIRIRRSEYPKTDRCTKIDSSNKITPSVEHQDERYRRSSHESVQSTNTNDVPVFFCSYDSLSEGQNSKSTSSSQIHRQDAVCFSSSSSIISDNMTSSRRRHSASPSPSRERLYHTKPRDRSRAASADLVEYPSNHDGDSTNRLKVSTTESDSRRCSEESIRSRRSNQSDASQYYRGLYNILKYNTCFDN